MAKRNGEVVSYSPQVAMLLGSTSRAVIGGSILAASAAMAPAAMAFVPNNGINLFEEGFADLEYTHAAGQTVSAHIGILGEHIGVGNIDLNVAGSLVGEQDGILLTHNGIGAINVDVSGAITADNYGISLNRDTGAVGQTHLNLAAGSTIHAGYYGIHTNIRAAGNAVLDLDGSIIVGTPSTDPDNPFISDGCGGVYALHFGNGDMTVNLRGSINSAAAGLGLYRSDMGDSTATGNSYINLYAGSKITAQFGVDTSMYRKGNLAITTAGEIIASDIGIKAIRYNLGNATIENSGTINAGIIGIQLLTDESNVIDVFDAGNMTVTNSGTINAGNNGIQVDMVYAGNVNIINTGTIEANVFGILAAHSGVDGSDINIQSTGTILSEYIGIAAYSDFGDIDVLAHNVSGNVNDDGVVSLTSGASSSTISVNTTGNIRNESAGLEATAIFIHSTGGSATINIGENSHVSGLNNAIIVNHDLFSPDRGPLVTEISNAGQLSGGISLTGSSSSNSFRFLNNGIWNAEGSQNDFGAGAIELTINGTWNAADSYSDFSNSDSSVIEVGASGTLNFGRLPAEITMMGMVDTVTEFDGLDYLNIAGTLTSQNGIGGEWLYTGADIRFGPNSVLALDIGGEDNSDILDTAGTVTIEGGTLRLKQLDRTSDSLDQGPIEIIRAAEINGEFDDNIIMDTAFLGWTVTQDAEGVFVEYSKQRGLGAAAQTANQNALAATLNSLGDQHDVTFATLLSADDATARQNLDQLSGEFHAGARTALMESAHLPRNAVLARLQEEEAGAVWGQLFGNKGQSDAANSRNSAKLDRDSWGFMAGVDAPLSEALSLGIAASYVRDTLEQSSRASKGHADSIHALVYAGGQMGLLRYKAGVGYAWGDVETRRHVQVSDLNNSLLADYNSRLFQGFAEVGVRFDLGGGYIEPIAGVTHLNVKTDAFAEKGGITKLTSDKASDSNTLTTLGARFSTAKWGSFAISGLAGWQHSFGDLVSTNRFSLANSAKFSVDGAARSRDAALLNVEGKLALSSNSSIGLAYDGVLGSAGQDHGGKISFRLNF